jgi:hypothetical protein
MWDFPDMELFVGILVLNIFVWMSVSFWEKVHIGLIGGPGEVAHP